MNAFTNNSGHLIENRILAALPPLEYRQLLPYFEPVFLHPRETLFTAEDSVQEVYFLKTAVVSLLSVMADGHTSEVGTVGNEGVVGVSAFMGHSPVLNQCLVVAPGTALKIKASILKEEFKRGGMLQDLLLNFMQALYVQVSQTAACNCFHTLDQRLARWLLAVRDRSSLSELELTHEFMAQMLGVRRSGVTLAASSLQQVGIINYSRGKLRILDQPKLENVSCECYGVVKKLYHYYPAQALPQAALEFDSVSSLLVKERAATSK